METPTLPQLITFDGEARSGKGTVVQGTKDYLRDECGYKTMLIDAGQVFRVLVVGATRAGIDLENPDAIDGFLADEHEAEKCVQLVKSVYHMTKDERAGLLYTNTVGANSAKIGARPLSQDFKDALLCKWMRDAPDDGYRVILLDGRALEETGQMLEREKLCDFVLGLYFVCDSIVGAMRTLGFANQEYGELSEADRASVDELVVQINARNISDAERSAQPLKRPENVLTTHLPDALDEDSMFHIVDTSAPMSRDEMFLPVAKLVAQKLLAD